VIYCCAESAKTDYRHNIEPVQVNVNGVLEAEDNTVIEAGDATQALERLQTAPTNLI